MGDEQVNDNRSVGLSRRERQIMDAIYLHSRASVAQVIETLSDPPGYSSVRKQLQILEEKGHVCHVQEGQHYVYLPTQPRQSAARSAMKQILQTFFGGNVKDAVMTLISEGEVDLTDDDLICLQKIIESAPSDNKQTAQR